MLAWLLMAALAQSDAELAERLARRDPRALGELYDRYGGLAYSLIARVARGGALAEDLMQETFLHVWSGAHAFDAQSGALLPWLLAVARHRAIGYLRAAGGGESTHAELDATGHPSFYSGMARDMAADNARLMRAALDQLAPNQREAIELAYFEGLTPTEIAVRMGQPPGTVKTWVRAALRNLGEQLGEAAPSATHEELQGEYELYTMGVAEDPARTEIRTHLERNCEVCVAEMRRAKRMAALIGCAAPAAVPSSGLRQRILASAGYDQRGYGLTPWFAALAALCLVAAFYFSGRERSYMQELANARSQMRQQDIALARLSGALAIVDAAGTREIPFGERGQGNVFVNPTAGIALVATNLLPAPAGKAYEMWIIRKAAKPAPAGMFQPRPDGTAIRIFNGPVDLAGLSAIAVTVEDARGAAQPTSQPVLRAQAP